MNLMNFANIEMEENGLQFDFFEFNQRCLAVQHEQLVFCMPFGYSENASTHRKTRGATCDENKDN